MSVPQTKAELLLAIDKNFSKLISYLNTIVTGSFKPSGLFPPALQK